MAMLFFLVRLCMIPAADFWARPAAVRTAAAHINQTIAADSPLNKLGGWLRLPWTRVLLASGAMPASLFDPASEAEVEVMEFRYQFVKFFVRDMIFVLWWLGPLFGMLLVRQRGGGWQDLHWGLLAGAVGGVIGSATLACMFLLVEAIPHAIWDVILSGRGDPVLQFVWLVLSLLVWVGTGLVAGLVLGLIPPLRRAIVEPAQRLLGWLCSCCGMKRLAGFWNRGVVG